MEGQELLDENRKLRQENAELSRKAGDTITRNKRLFDEVAQLEECLMEANAHVVKMLELLSR